MTVPGRVDIRCTHIRFLIMCGDSALRGNGVHLVVFGAGWVARWVAAA